MPPFSAEFIAGAYVEKENKGFEGFSSGFYAWFFATVTFLIIAWFLGGGLQWLFGAQ
jgi:hypothetical protein